MGLMVQRCHRWRQKRKTLIDSARTTQDEIERERLLQQAEHYGRIVNDEQSKIDTKRGVPSEETLDSPEDDEEFSDFKNS